MAGKIPTNEHLQAYYELWLTGADDTGLVDDLRSKFPAFGYTQKNFHRYLPFFHAFCRHAVAEASKIALSSDSLPDSHPLTDDLRSRFVDACGCGYNLAEVSSILCVPLVTITEVWFKQDPMLREQADSARLLHDYELRSAMHRRAVGYSYDASEETTETSSNEKFGTTSSKREHKKHVHVPGSPEAQRFLAKNLLGMSEQPPGTGFDEEQVEYDVRRKLYDE